MRPTFLRKKSLSPVSGKSRSHDFLSIFLLKRRKSEIDPQTPGCGEGERSSSGLSRLIHASFGIFFFAQVEDESDRMLENAQEKFLDPLERFRKEQVKNYHE